MSKSVTILAVRRDEAIEALTKLAKRGARYGQVISWTETARTEQRGHRRRMDPETCKLRDYPIMVDVIDLTIEGEAPRVGDYVLEAALERTEGGVIISAAPGTEKSMGKLGREWNGRCDHCGSERARVHGYIVAKGRTRKVVGKSCLRDHLGTDAPASLAARFSFLRDLESFGTDEESGSWGGQGADFTRQLIKAARAAITLWGWRPGSYEGQTTLCQVHLLDRVSFGRGAEALRDQRDQLRAELEGKADHYAAEADAIMDWAAKVNPGRNDYLHNLKVACAAETVRPKLRALVVSACAAYDKQMALENERKAEAAKRPASDWVATVGAKVAFDAAEFLSLRVLPDYGFGPATVYKFVLATGEILTWKTASAPEAMRGARAGQLFQLAGTVKGHSEFREVRETQLIRCKVEGVKA